jgi:hypothetical protein
MRRYLGPALLLVASNATAQTAEDVAAAEQLFRDGQALYDAGKAPEACQKFASSYDLAGGLGTLANLARCYETIGKTASAWALYVDLETRATRASQPERVAEARARIAKLEPRLSRLRVVVSDSAIQGMEVRHNGELMKPAALGVAIPVDPGVHRIEVTAPGYQSFTAERSIVEDGANGTISVPRLVAIAITPTPTPAPAPPPANIRPAPAAKRKERSHTTGVIGGVTGGVGVVVLGVAGGFALQASSEWNDAGCNAGVCTSQRRQDLSEDANKHAKTATGLFVVGGVLAVAGAVLLWTDLTGKDTTSARRARWDTLRF